MSVGLTKVKSQRYFHVYQKTYVCRNVLQCVAVCCSVLQCVESRWDSQKCWCFVYVTVKLVSGVSGMTLQYVDATIR